MSRTSLLGTMIAAGMLAGSMAAVGTSQAAPGPATSTTIAASQVTQQRAVKPRLKVGPSAKATEGGKVRISIRCAGAKQCQGWLRLRAAGVSSKKIRYTVGAGRKVTGAVQVSAKQLATFPRGGTKKVKIQIREVKPNKIKVRTVRTTVRRAAKTTPPTTPTTPPTTPTTPTEPVVAPPSEAYQNRNWTPTAYDTCSADLHRTYSVVGVDGKLYPTWHPPVVRDPATGADCTFGHEHGDDPSSSEIYTWVTDFLNKDAGTSRGIPFGYVSEVLDTYAAGRDNVTRHEDNVGHKVIVANNVRPVAADPRDYIRDAAGKPVTCDYLMKNHQGSHSGDATINNAHELVFAARCTDGTEVISSTMTKFGDANEFVRSCDPAVTVPTSGSNLPDGYGGSRRLPDKVCIDRDVLKPGGAASSIWSLYEVWESVNRITTPDGDTLASFDPWFGIRNPARAHDGGPGNTILDLIKSAYDTDPADGGKASGYPWNDVLQHHAEHPDVELAKQDPLSPFDGAQRDYYLQETTVSNPGGPTTWHTDPYGGDAVTTAAPGLIAQHLSGTDNSDWPVLERVVRDLQRDFGHNNGVHAPN